MTSSPSTNDYDRVKAAIEFLDAHRDSQPTLAEVATQIGLSGPHFQRVFKRWAGVSPKQYLKFVTLQYAKKQLDESRSVLAASLAAGLSGPGRLHDLFVTVDAVTPGEYQTQGQDITIEYGFGQTPFGECLLATTPRGICQLAFVDGEDSKRQAITYLHKQWSAAEQKRNDALVQKTLPNIFAAPGKANRRPVGLLLRGTNFQLQVWQALLRLPQGRTTSYQEIAQALGKPHASRAVGTAIGKNSIAWLIPCHRVIRRNGILSDYRWGRTRKQVMLAWEAAQTQSTDNR